MSSDGILIVVGQRILSYSMREIFRNVYEHSGETELYTIIQRYKFEDGYAFELTVTDFGIGVMSSLQNYYSIDSAEEALTTCIKAGYSGSSTRDDDSFWSNSGFGLFTLSEIAKELGEMVIISSNASITISKGLSEPRITELPAGVKGTIIKLKLKAIDNIPESFLENIWNKGDSIAPDNRKASRSTRQLPF